MKKKALLRVILEKILASAHRYKQSVTYKEPCVISRIRR